MSTHSHDTEIWPTDEHLQTLTHDVRGCLNALNLGLVLLRETRENEQKFLNLHGALEKEGRRAGLLVNELLKVAGAGVVQT